MPASGRLWESHPPLGLVAVPEENLSQEPSHFSPQPLRSPSTGESQTTLTASYIQDDFVKRSPEGREHRTTGSNTRFGNTGSRMDVKTGARRKIGSVLRESKRQVTRDGGKALPVRTKGKLKA